MRALVPGTTEEGTLRRWLRSGETLAISAVAWTDFQCGPVRESVPDAVRALFGDVVPLGAEESAVAAELFNASGRRRGSLVDCMIAATALVAGAELATSNLPDFRRFESLGLTLARG